MLKTLLTGTLCLSILGSIALGQDYQARKRISGWPEIFTPGVVLDLNLSMSQANWNTVQGDTSFSVEVPAMFWLGSDVPILVSVRRKSCDALNAASGFSKVSLKIDINEYVAGQEWYDLKKLSLENGDDEDVVTEGMAWELHRMATGPIGYDYVTGLANWATIRINGVNTGVYVNVEQRDKTFLKNRNTWVPDQTWLYHLDDVYSDSLNAGLGDSPEYQTLCYDPFQNPNMACQSPPLAGFQADLDALVDMKGMLTLGAVNAFMGHRDSLFSKGKNTMFADFSTGRKREYYPWDLDSVLTQQNHNIFNPGKHYADLIYAVPVYRAQFKQILGDLLAGPMHPTEMHSFLDSMETLLAPRLLQDANNKIGTAQDIAQHFQQKKDWVTDRAVIVLDQIAND
ncbi:MAG: hypothetical protein ACI8QC_003134 [Planctomycetota bacterium]|jgi:hypothetical protein